MFGGGLCGLPSFCWSAEDNIRVDMRVRWGAAGYGDT
jgi:hypothetical protein